MREHEPELREDAKNLSLITGSALIAGLLTVGFFVSRAVAGPDPRPFVVEVVEIPLPEPAPQPVEPMRPVEPGTPLTGINRLYGTVTTVRGDQVTGFIRWDRNEASWTDLLDATKPRRRGGSSISGIRFGHVDRLDVTGRSSAMLTLRSGERIELGANASDLGTGLRALIVERADGASAEFGWRDLESVDFEAPGAAVPAERRMFGTLRTRSGLEFTGYVTWDVDEVYSTDILDGDADGRRMKIAFGDIAAIARNDRRSSRVTLTDGSTVVLDGTNDVDASISGIEVSDATLGSVKLGWDDFDRVDFHQPVDEVAGANFDGGARLSGTVVDRFGERYTGWITWDADEEFTWEMLNGDVGDVAFHVELGQVERIVKSSRGSTVTLRDGRSFELSGSNDVDRGNRGITIRTDGRDFEVDWNDFTEVVFER